MVTLIIPLVGGFALAGLYLLTRAIARHRRGSLERRRLNGLGTADAHRDRFYR